ncbi:IS3 family transposase [Streptomyces sp. NPDC001380]|uniref:IS3 family transposase n=1 Tax=Streptomyces sp. NPDC001380 TaxID=3364566 RepID=UPI0036994B52
MRFPASAASAESFFAALKRELVDDRVWPSPAASHSAIFEWIEGWYNIRRLHSSLDHRSPADFEAALAVRPTHRTCPSKRSKLSGPCLSADDGQPVRRTVWASKLRRGR